MPLWPRVATPLALCREEAAVARDSELTVSTRELMPQAAPAFAANLSDVPLDHLAEASSCGSILASSQPTEPALPRWFTIREVRANR